MRTAALRCTATAPTAARRYASYVPPPWGYPRVNRQPRYRSKSGSPPRSKARSRGAARSRRSPPAAARSMPLSISARAHRRRHPRLHRARHHRPRAARSAIGEQRPSTVGGVDREARLRVRSGRAGRQPDPRAASRSTATQAHADARSPRPARRRPQPSISTRPAASRCRLKIGVTRVESEDGDARCRVGRRRRHALLRDHRRHRPVPDRRARARHLRRHDLAAAVPTVANGKLAYGAPVIVHRNVQVTSGTSRLDVALGK